MASALLFMCVASGCELSRDPSLEEPGSEVVTPPGDPDTPEEEPTIPQDYQREVGENMFWENGDTIGENGVRQNPDLHIYNYAPSVFQVGKYTRYAYYCSNRPSTSELKKFEYSGVSEKQQGAYWDYYDELGDNRITDYVACRQGLYSNGEWYWGPKTYVIGPTLGSLTEGEQTCDPCVVAGEFSYNGESYSYLMSYLACSTRDNNYNHVCLAVANDPMGPWIKCDDINPFLRYDGPAREYFDGDESLVPENMKITAASEIYWGYGQASMINTDRKSNVLMFYSVMKPFYTGTSWFRGVYTFVTRCDFSDLNNIEVEFTQRMDVTGLMEFHGDVLEQAHTTTNGDYAYDPQNGLIYAIFENSGGKGVYYVVAKSKSETARVGDVFRDFPMYSWTQNGLRWRQIVPLNTLDYGSTYTACHNNCIVRDEYGWTSGDAIEIVLTGAMTSSDVETQFPSADALYTFRLLRRKYDL